MHGFGALAKVIGRAAILFLRNYIVPAAKRVGADLLEVAVPGIAVVFSGRKHFKTATKRVGKQTPRIQLGSDGLEKTQSHSKKVCRANQSVAKRMFRKHFSFIMSSSSGTNLLGQFLEILE